uniref:Phosphatidylserine decarboxylase proenzyme, mitochondrial n=1 Tax=Clastoptera arizonana TaxID=38151 RepID=A0A1B6CIS0_9HEMI
MMFCYLRFKTYFYSRGPSLHFFLQKKYLTVGNQNTGRWQKFWKSWVPIPTGVGLTLLAVLQWRNIQSRRHSEINVSIAKDWEITCYRAIPCRALSRAWGWVSDCKIHPRLRKWVYGQYASMYAVNLDEMSADLTDYPSLAQFFTRELKSGVRPIDTTKCLVSPADGRVLNFGKVVSNKVEQVKGVTYSIQTFLGESTWRIYSGIKDFDSKAPSVVQPERKIDENENNVLIVQQKEDNVVQQSIWNGFDYIKYLFKVNASYSEKSVVKINEMSWDKYKNHLLINPENELYQVVIYLAPGDYHRFHSPVHWQVNFRRHFQGELLSVNPRIAGWIPELFCLNERAVYVGQWEHGFFCMAAVGATNVGSIRVYGDKTLHTNTKKWRNGVRHKDQCMKLNWSKGEEVGEFRMGSTIVLIFEAPKDINFNVKPGDQVKVGQSVFCLAP